mgnify:CR=1 FL=1
MNILDWYEEKERFRKEFYDKRKYLTTIEDIVGVCIHNDDYEDIWTDEIDELFSFLFDNAYKIMPFKEKIIIKYKDKFISLFEIHGQGCFRSIDKVDKVPKKYVNFEDIVKYHEIKEKPYRSYVMEIINRALNTLKIALDSETIDLGGNRIKLDEVRKYLDENLK